MNIENKLYEISEYFKSKLLTGDYEFIECGSCTAKILIDGKYTIEAWIANDPKTSFDFYDHHLSGLKLTGLSTQKERVTGWDHIKPHIQQYKTIALKEAKLKQIIQLEKEIESL